MSDIGFCGSLPLAVAKLSLTAPLLKLLWCHFCGFSSGSERRSLRPKENDMSNETICPTTIGGIKRLANEIEVRDGVKHMRALDLAARQANFENFTNAKRRLELHERKQLFPVTLFERWFDRKLNYGGEESLTIHLSQPILELVKPHHICGRLGGLQIEGENQFKGRGYPSDNQSQAQWFVCRRARTLQFMEVTGFKPTQSRRSYPKGRYHNRPPSADHDCSWYHPESKRYVLTDEPYPKFSVEASEDRNDWARRHNFCIFQSIWSGMHNTITELYLITKSRDETWLEEIVHKLEKSMPPISEENWANLNGVSQLFKKRRIITVD